MEKLKPLLAGERDRLCELTTRAMVLGNDGLTANEQVERERLALRLYVPKRKPSHKKVSV